MELAKKFDKKSRLLDRLPKRDLNRPGFTFGALLEQHFPVRARTSLRASAAPAKPPQLVLHMLWKNGDQDLDQYAQPVYASETEDHSIVLWDSDSESEDPEVVLSDPELEFVEARVSRRSPAPSRRSGRSPQADRTAPQPEVVTPVITPAVELEASGPSISAGGRRSSSVLTTPPASPGKARKVS
jgi:hypothetical protein